MTYADFWPDKKYQVTLVYNTYAGKVTRVTDTVFATSHCHAVTKMKNRLTSPEAHRNVGEWIVDEFESQLVNENKT